jgi:prepilin-type processing-associated H-X9-DG protein
MFREASEDGGACERSLLNIRRTESTWARWEEHANGIIAILIGLAADPSDPGAETENGVDALLGGKDAGARSTLDTWEHAFSTQTLPHHDGIIAILIGLAADPSDPGAETENGDDAVFGGKDAGARSSLDTWEHAFSLHTLPHHDGIIAILIGLAADPSDPNGDEARGVNALFGDGSVRFLRVDTAAMAELKKALAAADRSASADLVASDEYFALFSNTLLDDEAAGTLLLGHSNGTFRVTHDAQFDHWARVSRFDRGYLSVG